MGVLVKVSMYPDVFRDLPDVAVRRQLGRRVRLLRRLLAVVGHAHPFFAASLRRPQLEESAPLQRQLAVILPSLI